MCVLTVFSCITKKSRRCSSGQAMYLGGNDGRAWVMHVPNRRCSGSRYSYQPCRIAFLCRVAKALTTVKQLYGSTRCNWLPRQWMLISRWTTLLQVSQRLCSGIFLGGNDSLTTHDYDETDANERRIKEQIIETKGTQRILLGFRISHDSQTSDRLAFDSVISKCRSKPGTP